MCVCGGGFIGEVHRDGGGAAGKGRASSLTQHTLVTLCIRAHVLLLLFHPHTHP